MYLNKHACRACMHFKIMKTAWTHETCVSDSKFSGYWWFRQKFNDFSRIIQGFSNSLIFPCMELFFFFWRGGAGYFLVFHDFQSS